MFDVAVKLIGLFFHSIPTSFQIKHRKYLSPYVLTSLQFTFNDEHPFDNHWGSIAFHNPFSALKYKSTS